MEAIMGFWVMCIGFICLAGAEDCWKHGQPFAAILFSIVACVCFILIIGMAFEESWPSRRRGKGERHD